MSAETPEKVQGIDYFNRGHWLTRLQTRMSQAARRRMFNLYKSYARPVANQSLLDVGSTPDVERADSNCVLPWFREVGLLITLYSPEDISGLAEYFPYATILPTAGFGAPIPARDLQYDWVCASAVLEHVGGFEKQVSFIEECARVGRGVFITTPNRFHWLEFHTKLPFLHWLPKRAHRKILGALGLRNWAREEHLNLLGSKELELVAARALGNTFEWEIHSVWALGMPSNLVLLARRK